MKYAAVLFDLDGTLVDTAADFVVTLNRICDEHSIDRINAEKIRNTVSDGSGALVSLAWGINKNHEEFAEKRQELLDIYEQELGSAAPIFKELKCTINRLNKNNFKWGIVTNKPRKYTELLLDRIGLSSPVVICPCDLKKAKPDPEGLQLAAHMLGIDANQCIYLGDHERDIIAGKNAGMATISCAWGYIHPEDNVVDWQADYICHNETEVLNILFN